MKRFVDGVDRCQSTLFHECLEDSDRYPPSSSREWQTARPFSNMDADDRARVPITEIGTLGQPSQPVQVRRSPTPARLGRRAGRSVVCRSGGVAGSPPGPRGAPKNGNNSPLWGVAGHERNRRHR